MAGQFNDLAESGLSIAQQDIMARMRMTLIGLLCMIDEREQPEDCNCLVDEVKLKNVP